MLLLFVDAVELPLDDALQPLRLSMQIAEASECLHPRLARVGPTGLFPQLSAHRLGEVKKSLREVPCWAAVALAWRKTASGTSTVVFNAPSFP